MLRRFRTVQLPLRRQLGRRRERRGNGPALRPAHRPGDQRHSRRPPGRRRRSARRERERGGVMTSSPSTKVCSLAFELEQLEHAAEAATVLTNLVRDNRAANHDEATKSRSCPVRSCPSWVRGCGTFAASSGASGIQPSSGHPPAIPHRRWRLAMMPTSDSPRGPTANDVPKPSEDDGFQVPGTTRVA